jgi:hypothetical protein
VRGLQSSEIEVREIAVGDSVPQIAGSVGPLTEYVNESRVDARARVPRRTVRELIARLWMSRWRPHCHACIRRYRQTRKRSCLSSSTQVVRLFIGENVLP